MVGNEIFHRRNDVFIAKILTPCECLYVPVCEAFHFETPFWGVCFFSVEKSSYTFYLIVGSEQHTCDKSHTCTHPNPGATWFRPSPKIPNSVAEKFTTKSKAKQPFTHTQTNTQKTVPLNGRIKLSSTREPRDRANKNGNIKDPRFAGWLHRLDRKRRSQQQCKRCPQIRLPQAGINNRGRDSFEDSWPEVRNM